ncbi:MAG: 4-hydroxythreonine-4-phosphate dehydrogenase PdxA [Gammaproteobacteria bacterium]|nr:4-hydroxythreonine-4-phosphate dehydrogenase PdxA [Gammaproteobacteria bacterium]
MSVRVPRIVLTPGEPAGIGPDLVLMAACREWPARLIAMADPELLSARARQLGLQVRIQTPSPQRRHHQPGNLEVHPIRLEEPVTPGQLDTANARYVLETLRSAAQGCLGEQYDALVTGPVHKGIINDAGIAFTGHTEYLAALSQADRPVMMLSAPGLRVALVTTHLPLAQVSAGISREAVEAVLTVLIRELRTRFGLARPRISVCGLNPHAGEGGHLGQEETDIIVPALQAIRRQANADIAGPVPADTAFTPQRLAQVDAVLTMYHDQGLPVLKHLGFGQSVNVTLGLPFIRTSVDHGTALELAATGRVSAGSLEAALAMAIEMVGEEGRR